MPDAFSQAYTYQQPSLEGSDISKVFETKIQEPSGPDYSSIQDISEVISTITNFSPATLLTDENITATRNYLDTLGDGSNQVDMIATQDSTSRETAKLLGDIYARTANSGGINLLGAQAVLASNRADRNERQSKVAQLEEQQRTNANKLLQVDATLDNNATLNQISSLLKGLGVKDELINSGFTRGLNQEQQAVREYNAITNRILANRDSSSKSNTSRFANAQELANNLASPASNVPQTGVTPTSSTYYADLVNAAVGLDNNSSFDFPTNSQVPINGDTQQPFQLGSTDMGKSLTLQQEILERLKGSLNPSSQTQ